jgi:hypothetical protein
MPVRPWDAEGRLVVTAARHRQVSNPISRFATLLGARLISHAWRFEAGNLMANHLGACLIVDSRDSRQLTDALFSDDYGCRSVTRLAKQGGLGHIDELRGLSPPAPCSPIPALLRTRSRRKDSASSVCRRPAVATRAIVNALVVNGTAFVPQFGRAEDEAALQGVRDGRPRGGALSPRGAGRQVHSAIHYLTMNYPPIGIRSRP